MGINDWNAPGSAAVLEMARAFTALAYGTTAQSGVSEAVQASGINVSNRVRFCWWGGEESGLLGSRAYVASLNASGQLHRVALNLNFDMLGSPNYKTGVYNGTDAAKQDAAAVAGSTYIMQTFTNFFRAQVPPAPWVPSAFTGRSDYGPFLEMGIPAGGLDTGAEGIKSMAHRKVFGGLARTAYDPCYHQVGIGDGRQACQQVFLFLCSCVFAPIDRCLHLARWISLSLSLSLFVHQCVYQHAPVLLHVAALGVCVQGCN